MGFHLQLRPLAVIGAERRNDLAVLADRFAHAFRIGDRDRLALRFRHLITHGLVERLQHGVRAGRDNGAVKVEVGFDIGKQVLVCPALFHGAGCLLHPLKLQLRQTTGCKPCDLAFQQNSGLEYIEHGIAVGITPRGHMARCPTRALGRLDDEGAAPGFGLQQAQGFQRQQGFAQGGTADAELLREFPLRRDFLSSLQLAGVNHGLDLACHRLWNKRLVEHAIPFPDRCHLASALYFFTSHLAKRKRACLFGLTGLTS